MKMQLQKERIQKLLDAARSGKYEIVRSRLRDPTKPNCFCFLGLGCELYHQETGMGQWVDDWFETGEDIEYYNDETGRTGYYSELAEEDWPDTIKHWYGIDLDAKCDIIGLNDNEELSLSEIADRVESCLFPQQSEK